MPVVVHIWLSRAMPRVRGLFFSERGEVTTGQVVSTAVLVVLIAILVFLTSNSMGQQVEIAARNAIAQWTGQ